MSEATEGTDPPPRPAATPARAIPLPPRPADGPAPAAPPGTGPRSAPSPGTSAPTVTSSSQGTRTPTVTRSQPNTGTPIDTGSLPVSAEVRALETPAGPTGIAAISASSHVRTPEAQVTADSRPASFRVHGPSLVGLGVRNASHPASLAGREITGTLASHMASHVGAHADDRADETAPAGVGGAAPDAAAPSLHSPKDPVSVADRTVTNVDNDSPGRSALGTVRAGATPRWGRRLHWAGRAVMVGAVLLCAVLFRDHLPDPRAMWRVTLHAGPGWLAGAVLAQVASMGMFARVQRRLLRAGGVRMSLARAIRMTYAGNALSTTLPAGPAVSVAFNFRQYRRAGAPPRLATTVVMLGGVIMTGAYAVVGLAALVAEPRSRGLAMTAVVALVAAAGALVLVGRRDGIGLTRLARRALRPFLPPALHRVRHHIRHHRLTAPVTERLRAGRVDLRLRPADWAMLTGASLLNWVFDILSLAAAGRAVGVHTALYGIALAYFAAQAAGSLVPLLPGGLGAIEGSMAASLVAFGALSAPAGAAVALYRLVSFWGVVGVGWLAWLAVKAGERDAETAVPALDVVTP